MNRQMFSILESIYLLFSAIVTSKKTD